MGTEQQLPFVAAKGELQRLYALLVQCSRPCDRKFDQLIPAGLACAVAWREWRSAD